MRIILLLAAISLILALQSFILIRSSRNNFKNFFLREDSILQNKKRP